MRNNILAIVVFYAFVGTLMGGYVIIMQDNMITELEARQPKITEECINGILHRAQDFDGLKVYDSKFEECVG